MTIKLKSVVEEFINPINIKTIEEKGNIRILVPSSLENDKIKEDQLKSGEIDLEKINPKQYLKKNDIVFQAKGNKFEVVLIEENYENLLASSLYFIIRVNEKKINPKYLQWLLKTEKAKEYFEKNTSGTVMKIVRKSTLEDFEFDCPSLKEQENFQTLIRAFENEEKETLKYLESKKELIERKILAKYEVK